MVKLWLLKALPLTARWFDATPAACRGVCGPCVIATVSGLTMEVVGSCSGGQALPRVEKAQDVRTSSARSSVALVPHGPGESGCQAIMGSSARGAKLLWR